jgi:hypothetical protein
LAWKQALATLKYTGIAAAHVKFDSEDIIVIEGLISEE